MAKRLKYKYQLKRNWFGPKTSRLLAEYMISLGYKKTEAGSFGSSTFHIIHDRKITSSDGKKIEGYMACLLNTMHILDEAEV